MNWQEITLIATSVASAAGWTQKFWLPIITSKREAAKQSIDIGKEAVEMVQPLVQMAQTLTEELNLVRGQNVELRKMLDVSDQNLDKIQKQLVEIVEAASQCVCGVMAKWVVKT